MARVPLTCAVLVLAAAMRLAPLLAQHRLGAILGYDEGVHLGASLQLLAGRLPYRDFVFVQPPGIALLLAPFAALARLVGDRDALELARLFLMGVGVANTALLVNLVRRHGTVAMVVCGFTYATWSAVVAPERMVLLEPLLSLLLLAAITLIWPRASTARVALAGALLGASLSIKLWPLPVVLVLALWLWREGGPRRALRFVLAAALTATVIALPFFLAAPGAMVRQVVFDQLERPHAGVALLDRMRAFAPEGVLGREISDPLLAVAGGAFLVAFCLIAHRERGLRLFAAVLGVQLLELAWAPNFYGHYAAYAAPAAIILWAVLVSRVYGALTRAGRQARVIKVGLATAAAVMPAGLVLSGLHTRGGVAVDQARLAAFLARHDCAWAHATTLEVGNAQSWELHERCPVWVDSYGTLLDVSRGRVSTRRALNTQARHLSPWQRDLRRQFASSDAAVRSRGSDPLFSDETRRMFLERFRRTGRSGDLVFWVGR